MSSLEWHSYKYRQCFLWFTGTIQNHNVSCNWRSQSNPYLTSCVFTGTAWGLPIAWMTRGHGHTLRPVRLSRNSQQLQHFTGCESVRRWTLVLCLQVVWTCYDTNLPHIIMQICRQGWKKFSHPLKSIKYYFRILFNSKYRSIISKMYEC